jgi:hypothetical protein
MRSFARVAEFVEAGDFKSAIFAASKSGKLGSYRNAILDAKLAYQNPCFLKQVNKDPESLIAIGKKSVIALCSTCANPA